MSKRIFNEHQCRQLEANPNVAAVSERAIQYTPKFKVKAVNENLQGKGPAQIFVEHGFDLTAIGAEKPKSSLRRWQKSYHLYGEQSFFEERCGKGSTGPLPRKSCPLRKSWRKRKRASNTWKRKWNS